MGDGSLVAAANAAMRFDEGLILPVGAIVEGMFGSKTNGVWALLEVIGRSNRACKLLWYDLKLLDARSCSTGAPLSGVGTVLVGETSMVAAVSVSAVVSLPDDCPGLEEWSRW
jgi:hypothetical protein